MKINDINGKRISQTNTKGLFRCSKQLGKLIEKNSQVKPLSIENNKYYFSRCLKVKLYLDNIGRARRVVFKKEIDAY